MGFLDFMRVYIFSEVDGVVLMNGKPVSGAKVIRTADYKDKVHTDEVITDEQGRFHFDDIYTYSMRLSETAVLQRIKIYYEGENYLAWELLKRHDGRYGEINDPDTLAQSIQKLKIICELTGDQDSEQYFGSDLRRRILRGLCRVN